MLLLRDGKILIQKNSSFVEKFAGKKLNCRAVIRDRSNVMKAMEVGFKFFFLDQNYHQKSIQFLIRGYLYIPEDLFKICNFFS